MSSLLFYELLQGLSVSCGLQCMEIMRRSNCSAPIPPGHPWGQRKYACDKKGWGTRKKGDFGDYIGQGK